MVFYMNTHEHSYIQSLGRGWVRHVHGWRLVIMYLVADLFLLGLHFELAPRGHMHLAAASRLHSPRTTV